MAKHTTKVAGLDALHAALRELMCAGHPRDATPNGSDLRSIRRRSEAQGVNVLRSKTKVQSCSSSSALSDALMRCFPGSS